MGAKSQRSKRREGAISALNAAIEALDHAEIVSSITSAKTVFDSVTILLTMIRGSMVDKLDYVELGLSCADVCRALERGIHEKKSSGLNQSVHDAISLLTSTVEDIRKKLARWAKRNVVCRRFHARSNRAAIATWKVDLDKIIQVFNRELATNMYETGSAVRHGVTNSHSIVSDTPHNILKSPEDMGGQDWITHTSSFGESLPSMPRNTCGSGSDIRHDVMETRATIFEPECNATKTYTMVPDIHRTMVKGQEGNDSNNLFASDTRTISAKHMLTVAQTQASTPGESPPPAPWVCFGRNELIEKVLGLAESLTPIALVGPGGIGKTSVALTLLHHDHIKQRFGDNRRFIRCDQFPTSSAHLLRRLSEVIGAGVENPKDLGSLRPFLSSREILIVLDNTESILDPEGTDGREVYAVVEELSRLDRTCLCITSRISTVPPDCKILEVPTLSIDAARDAFCRIYENGERPDLIDIILNQLDFHPLSITLLATAAHQNKWDTDQLKREWERQRASTLQIKQIKSFAAAIEVSLASPMFQGLGPDARALLEAVAFFPQGVDENNAEWLFPTIPNTTDIFDMFCILSLTYRSNSFITMLAPLRDHLRPEDPSLSSLLHIAKEQYFAWMSVGLDPNKPGYGEARWIASEDVNVEYLLGVFITIDPDSDSVWDACANFMEHLHSHKKRLTVLGPKIEALPDGHRSKPRCLYGLSLLFYSVGNEVERSRLLTHILQLYRQQGDERQVALILGQLSDASRPMGLYKEGIRLAKEASEISERLGDTVPHAIALQSLSRLLHLDGQPDAAEETASHAIDLLQDTDHQILVCESHCFLGAIHRSNGEVEKAVNHYEAVLGIASSFDFHDQSLSVHYLMAELFLGEGRFDDAQAHVGQAKSYAVNSSYHLGLVMKMQAILWGAQCKFEEAKSEALRAIDVFEELGAAQKLKECREIVQLIEEEVNKLSIPDESSGNERETEPE